MLVSAQQSKSTVILGFSAIFLVFAMLTIVWITTVSLHSSSLEKIRSETEERQLIFNMRDAAHKRAITLLRMVYITDPFERDDEYIKFKDLAGAFIKARSKLLETRLIGIKLNVWERVRPFIITGSRVQDQAVDLILDDKLDEANKLLHDEVIPVQNQVMTELTSMLELAKSEVDNELNFAETLTRYNYWTIATLVLLALFIGSVIALRVIRKTDKAETILRDEGFKIRALYRVAAETGISPEKHIQKMLQLGCKLLHMDTGVVCRVDSNSNRYTVINAYSTSQDLIIGKHFPLDQTFCNLVFHNDRSLAINNVEKSQYAQQAGYVLLGFESYIGTPIWVKGKKFGVVNFSSTSSREVGFGETDEDLLNLISNWLSFILEQIQTQYDIEQARVEAESANRAKSTFLANMSHELRTPLNAIIGYSDMLTEVVEENQDNQYLSDLIKINSSGQHLLSLISNILDISKIEAGKEPLVYTEVEVLPLLKDIVTTIAPSAKQHNDTVTIDCPNDIGSIETDVTKVKQILLNVLSNAIKFTENGTITLKAVRINTFENDVIQFEIIDTGIGMTQEQLDKIFNAFVQATNAVSIKYGGTGLGLTISRQICHMLGGNISVKSNINKGSIFTVSLPAKSQLPDVAAL